MCVLRCINFLRFGNKKFVLARSGGNVTHIKGCDDANFSMIRHNLELFILVSNGYLLQINVEDGFVFRRFGKSDVA